MADLADTSLWAPVRQIETTDPVVGGPPNLITGAGMSNIPHQLLANRTKFLRDQIDGAGVGLDALSAITNLDALTKTGTYQASSGATGAPLAGTVFSVQHSAGASVASACQTARAFTSDRTFFRRKTGSAWQPWQEVWAGIQATQSLAPNGYQVFPSGLIMQWGSASLFPTNPVTFTYPITFPNNAFCGLAVRAGTNSLSTDQFAVNPFLASAAITRVSSPGATLTVGLIFLGY